ncbi:MAG TPA: type II secretion system protein [Tepidisphaeraceae bacterium]|jgi:prepilin-type N-terminal cleavage/methylation domain-containing protein
MPLARWFPASASTNCSLPRSPRRGFTLIELMVAIAIIGLILACIIPWVMANRQESLRVACANNIRQIRDGLAMYQQDYKSYPRSRFDTETGRWTAYTGPDASNPFTRESAVAANDVTASLWLLVRTEKITDLKVFICPSTSDTPDTLTNAAGQPVAKDQRSNFRSGKHLSYSFLSPFNVTLGESNWGDTLPSDVVLLADKNPGITGRRDDVTKPSANAPPEAQAYANSNNHGGAGQNVLYTNTIIRFERSAFRGSGYLAGDRQKNTPQIQGDNIYTALRPTPILPGQAPPANETGFFGKDFGPSWPGDSYLLPSDDE